MNTKDAESRSVCCQGQGRLYENEPLADYTTWRVGGKARFLYKPSSITDLSQFMAQLPADHPLLWLGLGSNCLIRDGGYSGMVIVTQGCLKAIAQMPDDCVRVEAGVSCATMARFCARNQLSGGEFWAGIPGTMGGALRMNAGCFDGETWQSVVEVETIDRQGRIRTRKPEEFTVAYRHVQGLASDEWFVSGTFRLNPGNKETSLEKIRKFLEHRAQTQPTNEFNCGSVFKNPPGNFAAKLIEACGLKGKTIGGASVSEKHANFIINQGGYACAKDIESLILFVKDAVYQQTAIELVHEVHILGEY